MSDTRKSFPIIGLIILCCGLSAAFEFDPNQWFKPKNQTNQQVQEKSKSPSSQTQTKPSNQSSAQQKSAPSTASVDSHSTDKPVPVSVGPLAVPMVSPVAYKDQAEIIKIQEDLRKITDQTDWVEKQSETDRTKLMQVLDQVKIQRRLFESLKAPPKPIMTKGVVNTDEVVRLAKIRLIGEQVRKTQEQIRTMRTTPERTAVAVQPTKVAKH